MCAVHYGQCVLRYVEWIALVHGVSSLCCVRVMRLCMCAARWRAPLLGRSECASARSEESLRRESPAAPRLTARPRRPRRSRAQSLHLCGVYM